MADAVLNRTVYDGVNRAVVVATCLSEGTGEAAGAVKVDVSGLLGAPSEVILEKIQYAVTGFEVAVYWDATTDVVFLRLQGNGTLDFTEFGGITNNSGAGKTGDIGVSTVAARADAGDTYTLVFHVRKVP